MLCVLLIASANVGNLLLVRASHRERELTVRAAIGGSRRRIVRQLLAESAILAGVSALLGVLLAKGAVAVLVRVAPPSLARVGDVSMDPRVLAFAIGISATSVVLFGLGPALHAATPNLADALRGIGRTSSLDQVSRLRHAVVVVEVALSFVLLVGCGLMVRTFATLLHADLGFDPNGVLTFTLSNRNFRKVEDRIRFARQVRDTLASLPELTGVTLASSLPLDGSLANSAWGTPEANGDRSRFHQATVRSVLPTFFTVMRTPIIAGRDFTANDDTLGRRVVIVDDVVAKLAYGTRNAIGRPIIVRDSVHTIVGVVQHQRQLGLVGQERGAIYVPWAATGPLGGRWALRTSGDLNVLAGNVRAAIATIPVIYQSSTRAPGPGSTRLLVNDPQPMTTFVDKAMAPTRFALLLIGAFAMIAAVLAAVGLYAVISSSVRQRTSEIGVRMAFGADASNIFGLVIGHGLRLSATGLVIGIALALGMTRVMVGMLVGVRPTDPLTFLAMTALFLAVAVLACWIPARRAATLDPSTALREDAI